MSKNEQERADQQMDTQAERKKEKAELAPQASTDPS